MNITILIPTKNRHRFLSIVLKYYDTLNFLGKILIIDSSDPEIFSKNSNLIKSYKNIIIEHYYSKHTFNFAIKEHSNKINTKYITISGDDDFHIIEGLEKSINYLEKNNLSGVKGGAYLFYLNKSINKIEEIREWSGYNYQNPIILENIKKFFDHPRSIVSGVFKSSIFKKALQLHIDYKNIDLCPSRYFNDEILLGAILVSISKIGKIDDCQFVMTYNHYSHTSRSNWEKKINYERIEKSIDYTANKIYEIIKNKNQIGDRKYINQIINNFIKNKYLPALKNKIDKNYFKIFIRLVFNLFPSTFKIPIKRLLQNDKKIFRILKISEYNKVKNKIIIEKIIKNLN